MKRITATTRIALVMSSLAVCVVMAAVGLGLTPDGLVEAVRARQALGEALAMQASVLISRGEQQSLARTLNAFAAGHADVLSAAVRREGGNAVAETDDHALRWQTPSDDRSTDAQVIVPLMEKGKRWGQLEVCFRPLVRSGWVGLLHSPLVGLLAFTASASFLVYLVFLRRVLQHLDPSRVVPPRVRSALDTLAEGLLVVDAQERIVLANRAFAGALESSPEDLQGRRASTLPWIRKARGQRDEGLPWLAAITEGQIRTGVVMRLRSGGGIPRTLLVNSVPVLDPKGARRGALATFEDVTPLEREKAELARALGQLKESREEIQRQNQELRVLATQDPLTGCLNRRSFFESFESQWAAATRYGFPLSCVMIDVDHFKLVNDRFGHALGDRVLKDVAAALRQSVRDCDLVCRYGGEEFCILLPHVDAESALTAAERYRAAVAALSFDEFSVTASFGVAGTAAGLDDPHEMLRRADVALYAAKQGGRNRVASWSPTAGEPPIDQSQVPRTPMEETPDVGTAAPFHAVSALLSSLSYRDIGTAEHSFRVADLCVAAASGRLPATEVYILEIAALLHDVGKVGVPDAILLKPGRLTDEERKVMIAHERIGVEILRATFGWDELTETVDHHHTWYDGNPRRPDLPKSRHCSPRSRILSIADAYDTMISDRVYQKPRTQEEAFAELRRCAGTQFDPELIEPFIEAVLIRKAHTATTAAGVSRETALSVGQAIESLAYALDKAHAPTLAALAGRLKLCSAKQGLPQMAEVAGQLEQAAKDDDDLTVVVSLTQELLDLCRSVQRAYLCRPRPDDRGEEEVLQEATEAAE